jgi:hypothetical protein
MGVLIVYACTGKERERERERECDGKSVQRYADTGRRLVSKYDF